MGKRNHLFQEKLNSFTALVMKNHFQCGFFILSTTLLVRFNFYNKVMKTDLGMFYNISKSVFA